MGGLAPWLGRQEALRVATAINKIVSVGGGGSRYDTRPTRRPHGIIGDPASTLLLSRNLMRRTVCNALTLLGPCYVHQHRERRDHINHLSTTRACSNQSDYQRQRAVLVCCVAKLLAVQFGHGLSFPGGPAFLRVVRRPFFFSGVFSFRLWSPEVVQDNQYPGTR